MSEPIRILQVFAEMNRGGAETMIMNLYRHIDRAKIQFDFIVHTQDKCAFDEEIEQLGGRIYRVPRYVGKNHFLYKKSWNEFFQKHPDYKIIHGHVRSTASIYLRIAKKYSFITIAHSHSTASGTGLSAIVKNVLQYTIRYTADYFFACSKSAGQWLFGKNICQENKFYILNNAIDAMKFIYNENIRKEKRKELNIDGKFVVGHIGRFQAPKNHNFLIDIFKEIHDKNENTLLLLVGDGELRQSIEEKVKNLGLYNNVIFTGVRTDIPELLQAMDVFIFPSLYEGLGLVAVEAQASGLKCIVADTITNEVKITDQVEFISLDMATNYWADQVLKYFNGYERKNTYNQIFDAGYDVKENTKWLEEFYIKQYMNKIAIFI